MMQPTSERFATHARVYAAVASLALLAITAWDLRNPDLTAAGRPTTADPSVAVVATDYRFDAPEQVPAGMTTFRLLNEGQKPHHLQLVRLTGGKTLDDLAAMLRHPGPLPTWAIASGGPNGAMPGSTSEAAVELRPGNYAMICWIPDPDHVAHAAKGMVRPLIVTAVQTASRVTPRSDLAVTLTEYAFTLSDPITAGPHTLAVQNEGKQNHEAVLIRLAPGKSAHDFTTWVDNMVGPPPGELLGGVTAIASGSKAYFTFTFPPGHYALLCFVPDPRDGKPHVAYGMFKEFTVT